MDKFLSLLMCLIYNLSIIAGIVTLAWIMAKYQLTPWLCVVMVIMMLCAAFPGKPKLTCPHCGYTGKVKTFETVISQPNGKWVEDDKKEGKSNE